MAYIVCKVVMHKMEVGQHSFNVSRDDDARLLLTHESISTLRVLEDDGWGSLKFAVNINPDKGTSEIPDLPAMGGNLVSELWEGEIRSVVQPEQGTHNWYDIPTVFVNCEGCQTCWTGKVLMLVTGYKIQREGRILSRVFRDSFTEALASDLLEACRGRKAVIKEDVTE